MTLIACLAGCKSDETTDAKPALELVMIPDKEIVIPASETGTSVNVIADCFWEITAVDNSTWDDLTVSPRSGEGNGTIVFTSEKNKSSLDRMATIVLATKGGLQQVVKVRQSKSDAAFETNLVVASNSNWEIKGADGIDWLEIGTTSGGSGTTEVSINVKQAYNELERSANLSVVSGDNELPFNIYQPGVSSIALMVNPTAPQMFPATSGSQIFNVSCNAAWFVHVPSSSTWINIDPMMGLGDGEFTVTYGDNPSVRDERQAYFIVTSGAKDIKQVDVYLSQEPAEEVIIPEEPHNIDPSLSR